MGGINSGRQTVIWGREKPIVEDSVILSVAALQAAGALENGASGIYRFDENNICYSTNQEMVTVSYSTRRRNVLERISLDTIPLYWRNGTSRRCFLCPDCKRRSYKLYITTKYHRPLCRACNHLVYEQQTHHHGSFIYRYWRSVKDERRYEANWRARQAAKKRRRQK